MGSKKIGDYFPVRARKFVSLRHGRIFRLKGAKNQAFSGSDGISKVFIQSLGAAIRVTVGTAVDDDVVRASGNGRVSLSPFRATNMLLIA